jgi:hypothetical protein
MILLKYVLISLAATLIVGFFFAWARRRGTAEIVGGKPKKVVSFSVALPRERVLERLKTEAARCGYGLEDASGLDVDLLLSDGVTAFSFGFFYPISLTPEGLGHTRVEIGIRSRAFQFGPVVGRHHRKCVETLKKIFF